MKEVWKIYDTHLSASEKFVGSLRVTKESDFLGWGKI
jgi:hypothetical protein